MPRPWTSATTTKSKVRCTERCSVKIKNFSMRKKCLYLAKRCFDDVLFFAALKYLAKLKAKGGAYNWKPQLEQRLDSIDAQVRNLCKKLLDYDNVPNKQKAFVNFCKNSLALNRQPQLAEKMWEAMGDLLRKPTQQDTKPAVVKEDDVEKKRKAEEEDGESEGKEKKKSKSEKKKEQDEGEEDDSKPEKKEKKKKKNKERQAASQGEDEEEEEEKPKVLNSRR